MNTNIIKVTVMCLLYSILVLFAYLLYGTEYRKPLGVLGLILTFIVIQILDKAVLINTHSPQSLQDDTTPKK